VGRVNGQRVEAEEGSVIVECVAGIAPAPADLPGWIRSNSFTASFIVGNEVDVL